MTHKEEWSVYAFDKRDPRMAQGYFSDTEPTEDELKEYRDWHQLDEEHWEITVSKVTVK